MNSPLTVFFRSKKKKKIRLEITDFPTITISSQTSHPSLPPHLLSQLCPFNPFSPLPPIVFTSHPFTPPYPHTLAPMADSDDEFVLSEVIAEAEAFLSQDGEVTYDTNRIMWLIDALLVAAYDDPSETILEPAFYLCELVLEKKQRPCQVLIRKAQVYFHQGSFILSRQTLDQAAKFAMSADQERDVEDFRQELEAKVTKDGKIAMFLLGGFVSVVAFWFLSRNKRKREEAAAAAAMVIDMDSDMTSSTFSNDILKD